VSRGPANAAEALSSTEGKRVGGKARKGQLDVRTAESKRSDFKKSATAAPCQGMATSICGRLSPAQFRLPRLNSTNGVKPNAGAC